LQTVTVGVTCKNNIRTIGKCVDSLLKLNYPREKYKIFVVDGFSGDGTYEALKKYGKRIILRQLKSNTSKAHNFIIRNSRSEMIALTDADCVVDRNWLRELMAPLEDKDVGATTGLVKTPRNVNKLQEVIGLELESRYRRFPKFVSRAPTMSLAFRRKDAILFDTNLDVAQETDWGYRFTRRHKMEYTPKAVAYHYHRASWFRFFRQQFRYAKFVPTVYTRYKEKMAGDHISTPSMLLSIINMYLAVLFLLVSPIFLASLYLSAALFVLLFARFWLDAYRISRRDIGYFVLMFTIRTTAWCAGLPLGFLRLL
jgi:glycosyltransferase involved in cell wall biosynthesis